ncbi:MAG: hypothetical protein H6739_22505 [Alphaproteobacteria bacterium]|nr:hypothetical protein [Alphaproteobacteria bacterium]
MPRLLPLLALVACRMDGSLVLTDDVKADGTDSGGVDTGPIGETGETGETADTGEPWVEPDDAPLWCLDFEDATLADAGYEGDFVELYDGALVLNVFEGQSFSALRGEESLDWRGVRALALRSSHSGEVSSVSIATTPVFEVAAPELWWWQLSEVDARGLVLYADLLAEDGAQLASVDLPVETGGFIPALEDEHRRLPDFPEIDYGDPTPGRMVQQVIDMRAFEGQRVKLRLYQHTRLSENGFFSAFDDLCLGEAEADPGLEWGPPDPSH